MVTDLVTTLQDMRQQSLMDPHGAIHSHTQLILSCHTTPTWPYHAIPGQLARYSVLQCISIQSPVVFPSSAALSPKTSTWKAIAIPEALRIDPKTEIHFFHLLSCLILCAHFITCSPCTKVPTSPKQERCLPAQAALSKHPPGNYKIWQAPPLKFFWPYSIWY